MANSQEEINEQVQKLKSILDAEVDQIEKSMQKTNDLLKEKLEHHRIKLKYLDDYTLPEHKRRLDQLEEAFELKEYFDGELLNE